MIKRGGPATSIGMSRLKTRRLKEAKQAEFLVHERLPWEMVSVIGVRSQATLDEASRALACAAHKPPVTLRRDWYY
ncbi:MAG TPA: DarT ssDNA thymidine ADP-ribosyltransferase family protein [Kofleriaceae bacterium]|nr:DarT ssDNA thymidine ADP-ribosyltransferase family protein [Kofleriaceae bacterium]